MTQTFHDSYGHRTVPGIPTRTITEILYVLIIYLILCYLLFPTMLHS